MAIDSKSNRGYSHRVSNGPLRATGRYILWDVALFDELVVPSRHESFERMPYEHKLERVVQYLLSLPCTVSGELIQKFPLCTVVGRVSRSNDSFLECHSP